MVADEIYMSNIGLKTQKATRSDLSLSHQNDNKTPEVTVPTQDRHNL